MKHLINAAILCLLAAGCAARAHDLAEITIIDRDRGTALGTHYYRGEYWVAGTPGSRYAIGIRNRLGERLLAVTSVDGVNVISGETAGWGQTGYVFGANESYQIAGWRKSDAEVAAFNFTSSTNSYADRTGRPANVGVIGVALFRERRPELADSASYAGKSAPAASDRARNSELDKLGTGHGSREYSYVSHTEFERMSTEPDEIVRIHYDSLENLIAMGIVRQPHRNPSLPNPFPGSADSRYVADPPG